MENALLFFTRLTSALSKRKETIKHGNHQRDSPFLIELQIKQLCLGTLTFMEERFNSKMGQKFVTILILTEVVQDKDVLACIAVLYVRNLHITKLHAQYNQQIQSQNLKRPTNQIDNLSRRHPLTFSK